MGLRRRPTSPVGATKRATSDVGHREVARASSEVAHVADACNRSQYAREPPTATYSALLWARSVR